jgi:hypothetical protein
MELFGSLESELKSECRMEGMPDEEVLNTRNGKIFRGENYLNLPYVLLDFPRLFSTGSIFAYRTMFWWGNGFSFTLHLQGAAYEKRIDKLTGNLEKLRGKELYICIHDNPWQYHFEKDNYIELDNFLDAERLKELRERSFIKICSRIEINQYDKVISESLNTFRLLMQIIS